MKNNEQQVVRRALGSGRWFPANPKVLRETVDNFIKQAKVKDLPGRIIGAIAPHAGYPYCGRSAGYVFRAISDQVKKGNAPDTVVILGISHRGGFPGTALMDGDAIITPLGEAMLDKEAALIMCKGRSRIKMDYSPHHGEHSAENEIPFVQTALPDIPIVVGIIGDHDSKTLDELVDSLNELAKTKKVLVIASSDMYHDPDYDLVTRTDKKTLKDVEAMDWKKITADWNYRHQIFCGMGPVIATMRFAEDHGCKQGTVLFYRNNGDDFPESRGQWVVGYGAVVFTVPDK